MLARLVSVPPSPFEVAVDIRPEIVVGAWPRRGAMPLTEVDERPLDPIGAPALRDYRYREEAGVEPGAAGHG
jgi:hypothetical protein